MKDMAGWMDIWGLSGFLAGSKKWQTGIHGMIEKRLHYISLL